MKYEWTDKAACTTVDPEIFFLPDYIRGQEKRYREEAAKAVCANCEARLECLQVALDNRERYGVWGGLTPEERLVIKRVS